MRIPAAAPAAAPRAVPDPYRILFPIGVAAGLIGAGVWPLHAFGLLAWPGALHRALMIPGFETAFVAGFLLTSMPAFTHGPRCRPLELTLVTAAMLAVVVASIAGWTVAAEASSLAALGVVVAALASRVRRGEQAPPEEFQFVGFGLLAGIAGAALRLALALGAPFDLPPRFAERLTSLGMVLPIVIGLGGLLVPTFAQFREPLAIPGLAGPHQRRGRRELYAATVLALAAAFALEAARLARAGAMVRAVAVAALVLWVWQPWRVPARRTAAAWSLWLSGWLIVLGLTAAALDPAHEIAVLHLAFLGGFALLTLGVGTRVVVAHGRHPLADEGVVFTPLVLAAMLLALACRLAAELDPGRAPGWLGASGMLWWAAWLWWGARALPRILGPRPARPVATPIQMRVAPHSTGGKE